MDENDLLNEQQTQAEAEAAAAQADIADKNEKTRQFIGEIRREQAIPEDLSHDLLAAKAKLERSVADKYQQDVRRINFMATASDSSGEEFDRLKRLEDFSDFDSWIAALEETHGLNPDAKPAGVIMPKRIQADGSVVEPEPVPPPTAAATDSAHKDAAATPTNDSHEQTAAADGPLTPDTAQEETEDSDALAEKIAQSIAENIAEAQAVAEQDVHVSPKNASKRKKKKKHKAKAPSEPINPWTLFFGKRNLVDATATLIFMHAGILLALNLLWTQLLRLFPELAHNAFNYYIVTNLAILALSLLFPLLICTKLYRINDHTLMGQLKPDSGTLFGALLLGIPASILCNSLNNVLTYFLIRLDMPLKHQSTTQVFDYSGILATILLILVTALAPAIIEEFFFRGFMQKALFSFKDKRVSILITALAFAFYHNDPLYFLGPFLMGLVLGKLRNDSESLLPPILAHLSMSLTWVLVSPLLPRFSAKSILLQPQDASTNLGANIIAAVVSSIVAYYIYRFIRQNLERQKLYNILPQDTDRDLPDALLPKNVRGSEYKSADLLYKPTVLSWRNYMRLILAVIVWISSRLSF